jgi:uncharacterized membrane protein
MDTLEKLAAKNRAHKKQVRTENMMSFVLFLGLLPFFIDLVYSAIYLGHEFPHSLAYMATSLIGALAFSFPLMAMGEMLILPNWFKVIALIMMQVWFTYFWVFYTLSWPAFLMLIPVFILLQFQAPAIKRASEEGDNGL